MPRFQKFGRELAFKGWNVTPLRGKIPLLTGWQSRPDPDFDSFPQANIGVVLGGEHNIIAVDIDVLNPAAAAVIKKLADDLLGAAPERIGRAPKTLLVYRCTEPTRKIKTAIYDVGGLDAAVEILAEGQQFAASGVHPDTGKPYVWPGDTLLDYMPEELTAVSPADIGEFLSAANVALSDVGSIKAKSLTNGGRGPDTGFQFAENEQTTTADKLRAALAMLPNPDLHYDDWVHIAHAIKGAIGQSGFDLFSEWSDRSTKSDSDETLRLWNSIGVVTKIGAGTVFHLAAQSGFDLATWDRKFGPADLIDDPDQISTEAMDYDEFSEGGQEVASKATPDDSGCFTAESVHGPLPEREWTLEGWFPHKTVGMLFGAGGVGKTLLMQQLANCVAVGAPFCGISTKQMPVLSVMCEDDALEIKRRQLDINVWRGLDEFESGPADCHLWPRVGGDNILVTFPNQGEDKAGAFFEQLCSKIAEVKGDSDDVLVILDTAADHFGGNENVRREVNTFVKTYLGSIVIQFNATVVLLAHPSLSGLASGSGLSGSTAWENSVRSRSYLSRSADNDEIRTLSRKKSNYSEISANSDITLIWDKGVLTVPAGQSQLDRINETVLKREIVAEIDIAWAAKNGIKQQGARGFKAVLPSRLPQHKPAAIARCVMSLISDGVIVYVDRMGFKSD